MAACQPRQQRGRWQGQPQALLCMADFSTSRAGRAVSGGLPRRGPGPALPEGPGLGWGFRPLPWVVMALGDGQAESRDGHEHLLLFYFLTEKGGTFGKAAVTDLLLGKEFRG